MNVICAWCEREGHPAVVIDKAPFDDPTKTHGICAVHLAQLEIRLNDRLMDGCLLPNRNDAEGTSIMGSPIPLSPDSDSIASRGPDSA
jgi:hypothetical protein